MYDAWDRLVKALASYNFYVRGGDSSCVFDGYVFTKNFNQVGITLDFQNKCCIEFPFAYFNDSRMKGYFRKIPHVSNDGPNQENICYLQRGSRVFDAMHPQEMVSFILKQIVEKVLDNPKSNFAEEFTRELPSYWGNDIGKIYSNSKDICCHLLTKRHNTFGFKRNVDITEFTFPFSCVNDVLEFGKRTLGVRRFRRFKRILLHVEFAREQRELIFENFDYNYYLVLVIKFDDGKVCFFYGSDNINENKFSRNKSMKNETPLRDKRVLVVGCGTLGSNLIPMLVKSGAGDKQMMTFVDSDVYKSENFSRHYLGLSALNKNKAEAMKEEMLRQNSTLNVRAISDKFENVYNKGDLPFDVVIDTTGNQAFSSYLNKRLVSSPTQPLFICGFIFGRSNAACSFVVKGKESACLACMEKCVDDRSILPKLPENFAIEESCNSVHIPFPITASIVTANLIMTSLFYALQNKDNESVFWVQKCDNNIWDDMKKLVFSKSDSCLICGSN